MRAIRNIAVLLLVFGIAAQSTYKKYTPAVDPEAQCLDGSPSILYVHEGGEPKKFLLFFLGGGTCADRAGTSATLESCYQRSMTQLGSSQKWPQTIAVDGYLSTDPVKNPTFANWTKVFFIYCDGMLHQGYRKEPIAYKGTKLYFKADRIAKQNFDWLDKKFGLYGQSTDVVLTGMSAGGSASFMWANYLQSKLPNIKLQLIVDSALFLNEVNYLTHNPDFAQMVQMITKTSYVEPSSPIEDCNAANVGQVWRCTLYEEAYKYINVRSLLVQSMYDTWSLPNTLGTKCIKGNDLADCDQTQMHAIQQHHQRFMQFGVEYLSKPSNNIWAIACANHVYLCTDFYFSSPLEAVPELSENTCQHTIAEWIAGQDVKVFDVVSWPNNVPCAHLRP